MGLAPARAAKAASLRNRPGCDQAIRIWAAEIGPTPCSASRAGARRDAMAVISCSSGAASRLARRMRLSGGPQAESCRPVLGGRGGVNP